MKAKLIKEKDWYDLYRIDEDGKRVTFASTQDYKQKLSLKNCQAIERGYDLDELTENFYERTGYHDFDSHSYKLGFQKALEILGDRRFTEEDLLKTWNKGAFYGSTELGNTHYFNGHIQSLQQNEWEVEIIEEEPLVAKARQINGEYVASKLIESTVFPKPKLDADGRLILKRVV